MGRGRKGSQLHMQDAVADRRAELTHAVHQSLPNLASRPLTWASPLAVNDYAEFSDGAFLNALGLGTHRSALREFWPSGGPVWDALGTVEGGGVVLVEAKAHVRETPDPDQCGAKSPRSRHLIGASLLRARTYLGVAPTAGSWMEHHYQIANRVSHLWWLHVERQVPAWLVLLGFTSSPDWNDPLTSDSWRAQVRGVLANLGIPEKHPLADRIGIAVMPT